MSKCQSIIFPSASGWRMKIKPEECRGSASSWWEASQGSPSMTRNAILMFMFMVVVEWRWWSWSCSWWWGWWWWWCFWQCHWYYLQVNPLSIVICWSLSTLVSPPLLHLQEHLAVLIMCILIIMWVSPEAAGRFFGYESSCGLPLGLAPAQLSI